MLHHFMAPSQRTSWRHFLSVALLISSMQIYAQPLSLNAALELAERNSPEYVANRAQIKMAQDNAIPAGTLPNPKLFTGIENFPISGQDSWRLNGDSMTMQKFGVMQDIPSVTKRKAQINVARAQIATAEAQWPVTRIKIRQETAVAWFNLFFINQKLVLYDELFAENKLLMQIVVAQIASGRGQIADRILPQQELVTLNDQRDELTRDRHKASNSLARYISSASQFNNQQLIEIDTSLSLDNTQLPVPPALHDQHLEHHPDIQALDAEAQFAEAKISEVKALKSSDWGIEVAYQRRAPQFGDMISAQLSFDLPIFTKKRINPFISAAMSAKNQIEAQRDAMLREHRERLANQLADFKTINQQLDRANTISLPLIHQKLNLQLASYKAGKTALTEVLATRRELVEQRLKILSLQNTKAIISAQIYFEYNDQQQSLLSAEGN